MKDLTTKELSILSKDKRHVISFIYNGLDITVLPPLRRINHENKLIFDYKYSVFVEKINQNKLIEKPYKKLHDLWFGGVGEDKKLKLFKRNFIQFLYYDLAQNAVAPNGIDLRRYFINSTPFNEYSSEFNAIFNDGIGTRSHSFYEFNEIRAKNQLVFSYDKINLHPDSIKLRKLKEPKKQITLII